jgi:hypothetical protein
MLPGEERSGNEKGGGSRLTPVREAPLGTHDEEDE